MNLPYISSSTRASQVPALHNLLINMPEDWQGQSQSTASGRRKHYVVRNPRNMDSKLMTDILGGPVIEEIKQIKRPRSSSRNAGDKVTQSFTFESRTPGGERARPSLFSTSVEFEITDLRDRLIRYERNTHDALIQLQEKLTNSNRNELLETRMCQLEEQLQIYRERSSELERTNAMNEQSQREMLALLISRQNEEKSEYANMRSKQQADAECLMKEQEKSRALFQEVVRLGENLTKQTSIVTLVNEKFRSLEQRMQNSENKQSLFALEESRAEYQLREKEERVQGLESIQKYLEEQLQNEINKQGELRSGQERQLQFVMDHLKTLTEERILAENAIRKDIISIREQFSNDQDFFQTEQNGVTQKIADMMKQEIKTRLDCDIDLKNLTSGIAFDIVADLNLLKDRLEVRFADVFKEQHSQNAECSSRSQKLSEFAEQECATLAAEVTKKFDKLKEMYTKLGEQFRSHLVHYDSHRTSIFSRIEQIESKIQTLKRIQDNSAPNQLSQQSQKNNDSSPLKGEDPQLRQSAIVPPASSDKTENTLKILNLSMNELKENSKETQKQLTQTQEHLKEAKKSINDLEQELLETKETLHVSVNSIEEIRLGLDAMRDRADNTHRQGLDAMRDRADNTHQLEGNPMIQGGDQLEKVVESQNAINAQVQVDLDQLASNISTVDKNQRLQIQELVEFQNKQEDRITTQLEKINDCVLNNLKIIGETTQTIEALQNAMEERAIAIEAELAIEKAVSKTDVQALREECEELANSMGAICRNYAELTQAQSVSVQNLGNQQSPKFQSPDRASKNRNNPIIENGSNMASRESSQSKHPNN